MHKRELDPNKLFMTEFMVVAVLTSNVTLSLDDICAVIHRSLQEPRSKDRIGKAVKNLADRGLVIASEFGNYCLAQNHKHMLRI